MNGDPFQRWRDWWTRALPGASREEIERRARLWGERAGPSVERMRGFVTPGQRSPAAGMFGETLEDSLMKWRRWIEQASAWMKHFQKEPPWQKFKDPFNRGQ